MLKTVEYSLPRYETTTIKKEYPGLNSAKGLLIFMVVLTHCLPESMPSYFMFLFHMPLFLSIGGFLLKQKAFENGFSAFVKRLTVRLIIPWASAMLIYLPLHLQNHSLSSISVADLLYPFYHLWYIPAYFFGSLVCFAICRYRIPVRSVLAVSGFVTLVWYIYYRESPHPPSELPLYWAGDKRFYAYLFFFVTGFALRNGLLNLHRMPWLLVCLIGFSFCLLIAFVFLHAPDHYAAVPYLVFNFCLAIFTLQYIAPLRLFQHKLWLTLNRQSLGVYLYHPLFVFAVYNFLGDPEKKHVTKLEGVGIGLVVVALVLASIWCLQKSKLTNKYLLGSR